MMKEKIKIYIILVLIIGGLIGGFLVWQNHQKTIEKKYRACLEKCEASGPRGASRYLELGPPEYLVCVAECKEKYAK